MQIRSEPAGRALEPAGRASEPAGRALKPGRRPQGGDGRTETKMKKKRYANKVRAS